MKKYLFTIASAVLLFCGCSSDSGIDDVNPTPAPVPATTPETSIQVGISKSGAFSQQLVATQCDTETGYFFIRIDNRIPGTEHLGNTFNSSLYFPKNYTTNPCSKTDYNKGVISLDEDLGYKKGAGVYLYIFSTDGSATSRAIVEQPSLQDLIDGQTYENSKVSWSTNKRSRYYIGNKLDLTQLDTDTLKIIWYVVKKQTDGWHIDGVLTGQSTTDVNDIPGLDITEDDAMENDTYVEPDPDNEDSTIVVPDVPEFNPGEVEVDIHQQTHDSWDEIKTAIHIRDTVDVTVRIPVGNEYLAEQDDFRIRVWTAYYTIENETYPVTITAIHETDELIINVTGVTAELLRKANEETDGDGITVEVCSYYKNVDHAQAWEWIKGATVSTYEKTNIRGQITSAFFTKDDDPLSKIIISYTKDDYDEEYPPVE